jgi:predicted DNA binding CopG/RHH family protein
MNTTAENAKSAPWDAFDADLDETSVSAATKEQEVAVDEALELQMISIRLQKYLISALKVIADHHKVGYQPMIRDLLGRFARSELKIILTEQLSKIEKDAPSQARMPAVDEFLAREGERKIA